MKKRNVAALVAAGGVALIIGVSIGSSSDGNTPGHGVTHEATSPKKHVEQETGPATSFRDGTFKVGTDIKAGTYKTDGKSHDGLSDYCYWQRARDDSGDLGSIIANDFSSGPNRVTVHLGEYFKTSGACDWKHVVN